MNLKTNTKNCDLELYGFVIRNLNTIEVIGMFYKINFKNHEESADIISDKNLYVYLSITSDDILIENDIFYITLNFKKSRFYNFTKIGNKQQLLTCTEYRFQLIENTFHEKNFSDLKYFLKIHESFDSIGELYFFNSSFGNPSVSVMDNKTLEEIQNSIKSTKTPSSAFLDSLLLKGLQSNSDNPPTQSKLPKTDTNTAGSEEVTQLSKTNETTQSLKTKEIIRPSKTNETTQSLKTKEIIRPSKTNETTQSLKIKESTESKNKIEQEVTKNKFNDMTYSLVYLPMLLTTFFVL